MTSKVASANRATSVGDRGLNFIALFIFCLFASGCQTTSALTQAALYGCGTNTIYLSGWWTSVHDKSVLSYDPMGGYQFAYWVDDAGNACHGDPGRNGQVGPAVISASKPLAYTSANNQSSITEEQLRFFQEIPISFEMYSGSGLHFVQFYNTLMRSRVDGKTFSSDSTFSIPAVMDIGTKSCVAPVAFRPSRLLFAPSFSAMGTAQDPVRCKIRVMPTDISMSEENRKKYHVLDLAHGAEIFNVR